MEMDIQKRIETSNEKTVTANLQVDCENKFIDLDIVPKKRKRATEDTVEKEKYAALSKRNSEIEEILKQKEEQVIALKGSKRRKVIKWKDRTRKLQNQTSEIVKIRDQEKADLNKNIEGKRDRIADLNKKIKILSYKSSQLESDYEHCKARRLEVENELKRKRSEEHQRESKFTNPRGHTDSKSKS